MPSFSSLAKQLLDDYAAEVSDAREWPNKENVRRTRAALADYIFELEQRLHASHPASLEAIQRKCPRAQRAFTGGGL